MRLVNSSPENKHTHSRATPLNVFLDRWRSAPETKFCRYHNFAMKTSPKTPTTFQSINWQLGPRIRAAFSLKNPDFNPDSGIPGLNVGYNTPEPDALTSRNRELFIRETGAAPKLTSWGIQVHGARVQLVTEPGVYPDTDALVTNVPGFALGVFVADCAAVLLADPVAGVIATAHAGWKGAVGGIVPETIRVMRSVGASPENIQAFVSPCISQARFEVGEEVAAQFPEAFIDRSRVRPHADLKGFVRQQLEDAGLKGDAICIETGCTMTDGQHFYSYRREGRQSGRMMGLIYLAAE